MIAQVVKMDTSMQVTMLVSDVEHIETAIADIKLDCRRVEDKVDRLTACLTMFHREMLEKFGALRAGMR